jgi:hypothetical protein
MSADAATVSMPTPMISPDRAGASARGVNDQGDLAPIPYLGRLGWAPASSETSLAAVFMHASKTAESAIGWYLKAKRPKKANARAVRGGSILLATLAGIVPMLAQMPGSLIAPIWGSVALALAAAFVLLDRFFGFSTAWMRYITTELHLRQMLDEFQLDWETERAGWKGGAPTDEQIQRALARCRGFVSQVDGLVRDEANVWVAEFQESLKQLDETLKAKATATAEAAISLTVTNGDKSSDGWQVTVDNGVVRAGRGQSGAISGLAPGIHLVRVEGAANGKQMAAETAVALAAGSVTTLELTLT